MFNGPLLTAGKAGHMLGSNERPPVKIAITMDELLRVCGPIVESFPCNKRRDPVERALLTQLGDPVVAREVREGAPSRIAGERPIRPNAKMVW